MDPTQALLLWLDTIGIALILILLLVGFRR
jgi:hypothetical protein